MEIQKLSNLLKKWRSLAVSHETIKKEIANIIFKKTGVIVDTKNITIKNNTLTIEKENPGAKSIIFIHKERILEELREKLNKKAPTDIR